MAPIPPLGLANAKKFNRASLFWLALILTTAAALRLHALTSHAYMLDECWSLEIATGRGSVHHHLPVNQVIEPPVFFSFETAPPWWRIWSNMEVTHPPLYSILLRWWVTLFGDTDYAGRLFSVIASLLAIAVLFDTVRLQSGLSAAVWAGLFMSLASPQVEHARLTRSYTLLTALALLALNLLVRYSINPGKSRRLWIGLFVSLFATLMTHYFCVGALAGLFVFALLHKSEHRRQIVTAFTEAALVFAITWGPRMWQQRHLFAADDASTLFLTTNAEHHIRQTIGRLLTDPVRQLVPVPDAGTSMLLASFIGVLIIGTALLPAVRRINPWVSLWTLWIIGTVSVAAILDFSRGTDHLLYIRYTILAGPAVCALIPSLFAAPAYIPNFHDSPCRNAGDQTVNRATCRSISGIPVRAITDVKEVRRIKSARWRSLMHVASGIALIACIICLPDVYNHDDVDPRRIADDFTERPGHEDLLMFAVAPDELPVCQIELFLLARYMQPMTCRVVILTRSPSAAVLQKARQSRFVYLDMQGGDWRTYFPGADLVRGRTYRGLGNIFTLSSPRM